MALERMVRRRAVPSHGRSHACRLRDAQAAALKERAAQVRLQREQDAAAWVNACWQADYAWSEIHSLVQRGG